MEIYASELQKREYVDDDRKKEILNNLLDKAKFYKDEHWYQFLRGIELYEKNNILRAVNLMEKAFFIKKSVIFCDFIIKIYTELGNKADIKLWESRKKNLVSFLKKEKENELLLKKKEDIEKKLMEHARGNITIAEQYIKRYLDRKDNLIDSELSYFQVLKEWSSSTPLMYQGIGKTENVGGGFFVRWKNIGIVIDPGLNFVQNMHRSNLSVLDIDLVIVTHNHIDHNSDLKVIMDIKYQCESAAKVLKLEEYEKRNICRPIVYYVDSNTYEEYRKNFKENACDVFQFDISASDKSVKAKQYCRDVIVEYFNTKHIIDGVSYGIKLNLLDNSRVKIIGFTSDTKYFPELADNLAGVDYLVANISEITKDDLKKKEYKHNHLGYHGCFDLICNKNIYPQYFILSEFWGGKGDIREEVAEYLKIECISSMKDICVISSDTSLCIDLNEDTICCSECKRFFIAENIRISNTSENKLKYLCDKCNAK